MSEETQETGIGTLKKTIIGIITTAITAAGAYVTTHIEAIFGGDEEEKTVTEQVEPVKKQEVNVQGPTINLTIPEQKVAPAPTRVIERVIEKPVVVPVAPTPKKEEDESDPW